MLLRLLCSATLVCFLAACRPPAEGHGEEQNNSHYRAGKEKLQALDYKGALASFERAAEENPRSALAHYELGLLYDQQENDYPAALYHYNKALKLRPNGYPADNIRLRIAACKQELVKADSLSVLNPAALRETERLREDNHRLQKENEALRAQLTSRTLALARTNPVVAQGGGVRATPRPASGGTASNTVIRSLTVSQSRTTSSLPRSGDAVATTATQLRTHSVKAGETPAAIARQYGVLLNALLAANPTLEPKRMKVGQILNLPSS